MFVSNRHTTSNRRHGKAFNQDHEIGKSDKSFIHLVQKVDHYLNSNIEIFESLCFQIADSKLTAFREYTLLLIKFARIILISYCG